MNKIKFCHNYHKLFDQTTAKLLAIELLDAKDVQGNQQLINYDTLYFTEHRTGSSANYYPLPKKGALIQLIFLGNHGIPFCTIRSRFRYDINLKQNVDKVCYYEPLMGDWFDIVILEDG